ncbi:hypothetical protein T4A_6052 [Trichinella pseudospiralis]|uniref:Uncharacterized protein n=1 Tax=Trichinella pseudospiralis TaxID=6337 RepID=A0A0V1EP00_TRIPS|nr:hypothetical protein T4A_6052 [Trichinella pseudospiralis]
MYNICADEEGKRRAKMIRKENQKTETEETMKFSNSFHSADCIVMQKQKKYDQIFLLIKANPFP